MAFDDQWNRPTRTPQGSGKLGPVQDAIIAKVQAQPDITMAERAAWLQANHGVMVDPSNLSKLLCRHGLSKKTLLASEKERVDVIMARRT